MGILKVKIIFQDLYQLSNFSVILKYTAFKVTRNSRKISS